MMKKNGQEQPFSLYKFYLHDDLIEKLEFLKKGLDLKTNAAVFSAMITHTYNLVREWDDYVKTIPEQSTTDVITNDTKV